MPKKGKDAFADEKGNITAVLLEGNKTPTPLTTAIRMAGRDQIKNVHVAHTGKGNPICELIQTVRKR